MAPVAPEVSSTPKSSPAKPLTIKSATPQKTGAARTPSPANTPRRRREDRDNLARFQLPLVWFRWLVYALSLAASFLSGAASQNRNALLALFVWTCVRTLEPVRLNASRIRTVLPLVIEFGVAGGIVVATGGWGSPNTLMMLPPLMVIASISGTFTGMSIALGTGVLITSTMKTEGVLLASDVETGVRWTGILLLVTLLVGTGVRIISQATKDQQLNSVRMQNLQDANTLLYDLQRIARRLPASLDLAEVLRATTAEFASTTGLTRVTVLLRDEGDAMWSVAETLGCSMPMSLDTAELPAGARTAISARTVVTGTSGTAALLTGGIPGTIETAVYAPLLARDQLIGVVIAEALYLDRWEPANFIASTLEEVARQLVGPAAVAIDNARWFGRIRSAAADNERIRIARDLHDRIGQSLALLGFEVDRITRVATDEVTKTELIGLRQQVTQATQEVRETLYDLRTGVNTDDKFADVLQEFLTRVENRSGITTSLESIDTGILPIHAVRELWQIAQEAIINAERHSKCETLKVRWRADATSAEIDIVDDGIGFQQGAGRKDSYGLRGLRERAAGIGAHVDVKSEPGAGTTIRVRLLET
jgi:signal transduction histidine kinase